MLPKDKEFKELFFMAGLFCRIRTSIITVKFFALKGTYIILQHHHTYLFLLLQALWSFL